MKIPSKIGGRKGLAVIAAAISVQCSGAAWAINTFSVTLPVEADTFIRTDVDARRNDNYGKQQMLLIGTGRGGGGMPYGAADAERSLLRFDLSGQPSEPLISAKLVLSVYEDLFGSKEVFYTLGAHRVIASGIRTPWQEGNGFEGWPVGAPPASVDVDSAFGVAWAGTGDNPDPSAANNTTQPDYDAVAEATTLVNRATTTSGDIVQWDLTGLVNRWRAGTTPNLGLVLRDPTTAGDYRELRFDAKDGANLSIPDPKWHVGPRLLLEYQAQPAKQDDCRNELWRNYSALIKFKNQGDCMSFVVTRGRNTP
ncbi:MAG: DNRLRE domain-containing protein [Betaproteobacteria bacterium]|jgi:hypothetical protein